MSARPAEAVTFSLEIPTDPTMLSSARLFAAAVAREAGCPEAVLDDVKLAVSEACTDAIRRAAADGSRAIELRAELTPDGLAFRVSGPAGTDDLGDDDLDHFSLIAALFNDARRDDTSISFTAPLAELSV